MNITQRVKRAESGTTQKWKRHIFLYLHHLGLVRTVK